MRTISHQQICAYLHDNCELEELVHIEQLRRNDRALDTLFQVMEELKKYAKDKGSALPGRSPKEFDVEETLERLLGGNIRPADAQLFIERLLNFPSIAERIYGRFSQLALNAEDNEVPELGLVQIRSDEELFEEIKSASIESLKEKFARVKQQISPVVAEFWTDLIRPDLAKPTIPRLATVVVIVLIAAVSFLVVKPGEEQKREMVYDILNRYAPYEYDSTSLRGATDHYPDNPQFISFSAQFKSGISEYLLGDYQKAIVQLETLESTARTLQQQTKDKDIPPVLRDYYFYWGQSHLAMVNHNESEKAYHINQALAFISRAEEIGKTIDTGDTGREDFYLGLAYELAGRTDSALARLRKIKSKSEFYKDGTKLINVLAAH